MSPVRHSKQPRKQVPAMMSLSNERESIVTELNNLSLQRHQLMEKKKIQHMLTELRSRAEFEQREGASSSQKEIHSIDVKLQQLKDKQAELQQRLEKSPNPKDTIKDNTEMNFPSSSKTECTGPLPSDNIFFVEAPPTFPAPTVHLDLNELPQHSCKTQCPECRQFVTTETSTTVNDMTWMACFILALMGCVAGCCLIPFCCKKFKSTTHRCPVCRTSIQTVRTL